MQASNSNNVVPNRPQSFYVPSTKIRSIHRRLSAPVCQHRSPVVTHQSPGAFCRRTEGRLDNGQLDPCQPCGSGSALLISQPWRRQPQPRLFPRGGRDSWPLLRQRYMHAPKTAASVNHERHPPPGALAHETHGRGDGCLSGGDRGRHHHPAREDCPVCRRRGIEKYFKKECKSRAYGETAAAAAAAATTKKNGHDIHLRRCVQISKYGFPASMVPYHAHTLSSRKSRKHQLSLLSTAGRCGSVVLLATLAGRPSTLALEPDPPPPLSSSFGILEHADLNPVDQSFSQASQAARRLHHCLA